MGRAAARGVCGPYTFAMTNTASIGVLKVACALSQRPHPVQAANEVCEQALVGLSSHPADLVIMSFTRHHSDAARALAYAVRRRLDPRVLVGISAESVIGGQVELEGEAGVSLFAASLPGVDIRPFRISELLEHVSPPEHAVLASAAGMTGSGPYRGTLLFADPCSVPSNTLLPALARARPTTEGRGGRGRGRPAPIIGGLASAADAPGENVFVLNDDIIREGGVGVSLAGAVRIDSLVSQGCRPFGTPLIITAGKGQIITALNGKPALTALLAAIETLSERDRRLCERGILVGRVINEYKERFGRDDFLIRALLGVDRTSNALAVADLLRVGQTIQFHVRDATTASEDMQMLLDFQRLHEPPAGAFLFTCNGRGRRLFETPNHDASTISTAFSAGVPGEQSSKSGQPIFPPGPIIPLAGFFAGGEIGPIGDGVFVHGQTAIAALFRTPTD